MDRRGAHRLADLPQRVGARARWATSSLPLVTLTSGDETIAALAGDLPNTATDAYQGLYQLRLKTSGPGQPAGCTYDSADILITGTPGSVVYPAPVATATSTSLTSTPASPQQAGTSVTLNATVISGGAPARSSSRTARATSAAR